MSNPSSSNQVYLYNSSGTLQQTFTNTDGTAIQDAITAASAGDTIQIGGGIYDENVNVTVSGLTIENVAGQQVTIVGQGGYTGALTVATGVYGVTIQSSDGNPANFVVEGSQTTPQVTALYIEGTNDNIKINGITTIAPLTQDGGLNSVLTGGDLNNVLFENNVFTGKAQQLVYVLGAEDVGPQAQDGYVNETDMLLQNTNSGAFEIYDIRNNQIVGAGGMGQVGLQWTVAGLADFSGNANETDLLLRNSASGAFELFDISKNAIASANAIGSVGLGWQVTGVAADPPPSAAASTVLSGMTNDPASGASISQLTQAMASIAAPGSSSSATSPLGQSPMPAADVLTTTTQNNSPI
jgi:hypothetical protein